MEILLTQVFSEEILNYYISCINNFRMLILLIFWADDENVKKPWIEAGLLHLDYTTRLENKLQVTPIGGTHEFTLEDAIQLYTILHLSCKFELSEMGDIKYGKLENLELDRLENIKKAKEAMLKSSEVIVRGLKESMEVDEEFVKAIEVIDDLEIVTFTSRLLRDI